MHKPITAAVLAALVGAGGVLAPSYVALASAPSGAGRVKALVPKGVFGRNASGAKLLADYGSFGLYQVDAATLNAAKNASSSVTADPEADLLQFSAHPFDTQRDTLAAPAPFSLDVPSGPRLQMVQFVGPVKQDWLDALSARNIVPVHYVASNGYIVWADSAAQAQLANLSQSASWLQYHAPFYGFLKVDPTLGERLEANPASHDEVDVVVQIYRHAGDRDTRRFVESLGIVPQQNQAPLGSGKASREWSSVLKFANLKLRVRLADVAAIAERADVMFVGLKTPNKMMDEKQDIIMTGNMSPTPGISYLQFLIDHGFSQTPADYPIVDLTDSTIDEGGSGVTVLATADPRMHVEGDLGQPVRVAYFKNCSSTPDSSVGAIDGHGSLNAGIIIGYDQTTGSPYQDADGFQLGLGINPFGRVGSTAIFVPSYNVSNCGNSDQGVILANSQNGARISSNSWGATIPPSTYDDSDQAYDVGTRDADPTTSGNQSMIYVFSAANDGPSAASVSSPAAGKNVITVGASENVRNDWTDGCGVGPTGADNAEDVASFSSRGPAPGQRAKPEVIGPGTHIQSGASNYSGYTGTGVCDQYHPNSQTIFAASSGTSHSTPATAGIAQLSYWWIEHGGAGAAAGTIDEIGGAAPPSPALMKAWMMAHPTYLTGVGANDNLPSNSQGYGMPNMTNMFDTTAKVLLDQSEVFDNTGETYQLAVGIEDPGKPVRVALAYTDAPGTLGTNPQVNNLDLEVVNGSATYLGNHFDHAFSTTGGSADTKNNYEAVFLPAGTTGDLLITVKATNIAGDGVPNSGDATDQDFALVCYNCSQGASFTLATPTTSAEVCAGTDYSAPITIGQISGFSDPVNLSVSGAPAGSTAAVDPDLVTPPGSSTLSVTDSAGVAAGDYTVTVTGTSGSIERMLNFDLTYATLTPLPPTQDMPVDGATNVDLQPTLTWEAAAQATGYHVEVATDADFTNIVASADVATNAWTVTPALDSNTQYYWRVSASNACGESAAGGGDRIFGDSFEGTPLPPLGAESFSFTTLPLPGDCPIGTTPSTVFEDDIESGTNGWTHSGTGDTWTIGSAAHGGTHAWQANNAAAVTDQRLVSPAVALPNDLDNLTLTFWNQQSLESNSPGCFDGGILEVSTDGGSSWTQVTTGLLTDPYDGPVSTSFSNPLGGLDAWCGDPEDYTRSVVDLGAYAGMNVQFRFRMANDASVAHPNPGWAIDDVKVAGCSTP